MSLTRSLEEVCRVDALKETGLLDTIPEESFDRYTRLGITLMGTPVILISLVDRDRQFFKSQVGLPEPYATTRVTPLSHSFCKHVVHTRQPLVICDARREPLVQENPAVRDLGVRAYLGIPLRSADGQVLGSLCALDTEPRIWTEQDIVSLTDLAGAVSTEIQLRTLKASKSGPVPGSPAS